MHDDNDDGGVDEIKAIHQTSAAMIKINDMMIRMVKVMMMMKMIMMTTAMVLMRLKAIHQTLAASGRLFHLFFRGRCTIAHVRSSRQCQDDDDEENHEKN